ncbi:hypothetical protein [Marinilactibacillus kalidii]|uniref:hypothetical protein n=1 Tax=Marinilactibacillus kalidii TaxID=2820274 RepID=UPI001ABDB628|nr:hypothetical protein [Marinilactibacillus kalidii]
MNRLFDTNKKTYVEDEEEKEEEMYRGQAFSCFGVFALIIIIMVASIIAYFMFVGYTFNTP